MLALGYAGRARGTLRAVPDKSCTQRSPDSQAGGHYKKRNNKGMGNGFAAVTAAQHAVKNAANHGDAKRRADL